MTQSVIKKRSRFILLTPLYKFDSRFETSERKKTRKSKRRRPARVGRGAYIGNRVSLFDQKSQNVLFCEEKWSQKVVQFQNGIFLKNRRLPPGSIPEWNLVDL